MKSRAPHDLASAPIPPGPVVPWTDVERCLSELLHEMRGLHRETCHLLERVTTLAEKVDSFADRITQQPP